MERKSPNSFSFPAPQSPDSSSTMAAEEELVDRLSDLSDELIRHIFSFLPTHDSKRTSYLSTRFRYLWRSVPVLDVRDNLYHKTCPFERFMDYVLRVHENLAIIRRFRLVYLNPKLTYDNSEISNWIDVCTTASRSNLEAFHLHLPSTRRRRLDLPGNVFSCRKLETIGLYGGITIDEIPVDQVLFSCLKTLRLRGIAIVGCNTLSKLLSGCPRLGIFDIKDCVLVSVGLLPQLTMKKLYLEYDFNPIRINEDYGHSNHVLSEASASIDVTSHISELTFDLLKSFSNVVKHLEICNINKDRSFINSDDNGVVVWENLTHLVVKDKDNLYGSGALSFLLEHSPNLVSLVLEKEFPYDEYIPYTERDILRVPLPSISYHKLEMVKINGFEDGSGEMEIVKYILKNALVLKKLVLCYVRISEGIKMSIMDEPRASTQCEIRFLPLKM